MKKANIPDMYFPSKINHVFVLKCAKVRTDIISREYWLRGVLY